MFKPAEPKNDIPIEYLVEEQPAEVGQHLVRRWPSLSRWVVAVAVFLAGMMAGAALDSAFQGEVEADPGSGPSSASPIVDAGKGQSPGTVADLFGESSYVVALRDTGGRVTLLGGEREGRSDIEVGSDLYRFWGRPTAASLAEFRDALYVQTYDGLGRLAGSPPRLETVLADVQAFFLAGSSLTVIFSGDDGPTEATFSLDGVVTVLDPERAGGVLRPSPVGPVFEQAGEIFRFSRSGDVVHYRTGEIWGSSATHIVISSCSSVGDCAVVRLDSAGNELEVPDLSEPFGFRGLLSPDGNSIARWAVREDGAGADVWVVNLVTGTRRQAFEGAPIAVSEDPPSRVRAPIAWTPDSRRLVGATDVALMSYDTAEQKTQLVPLATLDLGEPMQLLVLDPS